MKRTFLLATVLLALGGAGVLTPFPEAEISNGLIRARFYLPDSAQGYYRGTRFDWSGVMPRLEYRNHSYFGQWFEKYDPKLHDAISGPVEEFTPLGYETAKPGESFLKIGVGSLRKAADEPYRFLTPFAIENGGSWSVTKSPDGVRFRHVLNEAAGYSYDYEKTVRLLKGKPVLVLEHRLKNTGSKAIETSVYNHNFFMLDNQPSGPELSVTFPFPVGSKSPARGFGTLAEIRGNQLIYRQEVPKGESTHAYLTGFGDSAKDYDIRIENRKTGAGVRIRGDRPLSNLVFWSVRTVLSPEPYIAVRAEPGKECRWRITYEFYERSQASAGR